LKNVKRASLIGFMYLGEGRAHKAIRHMGYKFFPEDVSSRIRLNKDVKEAYVFPLSDGV